MVWTALALGGVCPPRAYERGVVAEAQRLAGVTSVALYVVDIDGTLLLRLAVRRKFPSELEAPSAMGPEIRAKGSRGCTR